MAINVSHDNGDTNTIAQGARVAVRNSANIPYIVVENSTDSSIDVYKGDATTPTDFAEQDVSNNPSANIYGSSSAAIDSNDVIHIVYAEDDAKSSNLHYIQFDTGDDTFKNGAQIIADLAADVDAISNVHTGIAIDFNGKPHVVFRNDEKSDDWTINYINNIDGSWNSGTYYEVEGDTNSKVCSYPDIAIDIDNLSVICYFNETDNDVGTAIGNVNDATSFTLQDIDTDGSQTSGDQKTSICVDSSGNHWVAYEDHGDGYVYIIKHAYGVAWSTWGTRTTDSTNLTGINPSIVADGEDIYVFLEDGSNDIHYASYISSSWTDGGAVEEGTYNTTKANWSLLSLASQTTQNSTDQILGGSTGGSDDTKLAQSFSLSKDAKLGVIFLRLLKVGSPTDDLKIQIRSSLDGTTLSEDSINGANLTNSLASYGFDIGGASVSASTTYYLQLERSGSRDVSNYYLVSIQSSGNPYGGGQHWHRVGTSWSAYADSDFHFKLFNGVGDVIDYVFTDETATPDILFNNLSLAVAGNIDQIATVSWSNVGQLGTVAEASIDQVAGITAN